MCIRDSYNIVPYHPITSACQQGNHILNQIDSNVDYFSSSFCVTLCDMNESEEIPSEEPVTKDESPPPLPVGAMVNPFHMYKRDETPYVTYGILGMLILIFAADQLGNNILLSLGWLHGPSVLFGEYWRMFTAMFLHAGLFHIGFNGYALAMMGSDIERLYGRGRFLAIYILSGLFGSLVSFAMRALLCFS